MSECQGHAFFPFIQKAHKGGCIINMCLGRPIRSTSCYRPKANNWASLLRPNFELGCVTKAICVGKRWNKLGSSQNIC
jgi:hypothetical protein